MSHRSNSTWLFMRINSQLQTSGFVNVDLGCDDCHVSSESLNNPFLEQSYIWPPLRGFRSTQFKPRGPNKGCDVN